MLRTRIWNIFLPENLLGLKRLTTNNATFVLVWLKKLSKDTFKTLTYQKLQDVLDNCEPPFSQQRKSQS